MRGVKMNLLEVENLSVEVEGIEIIKNVSFSLKKGEIVALMGPNGSGKSTLAYALMGHPKYKITSGKILFHGSDVTNMPPDERSRSGMFLSFQNPHEISGVSVSNFLRMAVNSKRTEEDRLGVLEFRELLDKKMKLLKMDKSFVDRYLNEGFSGGEKKRAEILQLAMLEPKLAILDETDSGLDIDALKTVADGVIHVRSKDMGIVVITHYQRILNYLTPDRIIILMKGKIVHEGKKDLIHKLESEGYEWLKDDIQDA
jgi:Fe-S cluster assembly ATP-binding protein